MLTWGPLPCDTVTVTESSAMSYFAVAVMARAAPRVYTLAVVTPLSFAVEACKILIVPTYSSVVL